MYTKEKFLSNSTVAKFRLRSNSDTPINGVLTKEEAEIEKAKYSRITTITNVDTGDFFFTDDYCIGAGYLSSKWVPGSTNIPLSVKPRKSLPSGEVKTVDDYILIFHRDGRLIESVDDLMEVLNSEKICE